MPGDCSQPTFWSQSQSAAVVGKDVLEACQELARVLHGASKPMIRTWTAEHVHNAFGWAEHVEYLMRNMVTADVEPLFDADLAAMQEQDEGRGEGPMVRRSQLALTVAVLRDAQGLLLRMLLQNHAASHDVASATLARALTRENGAEATTAELLPGVQLHAQLQLLRHMQRRATSHDDDDGAVGARAADAAPTEEASELAAAAATYAAAAVVASRPDAAAAAGACRRHATAERALAQLLYAREPAPLESSDLAEALSIVQQSSARRPSRR